MKVKVVFWLRKKLFAIHGPIEDICSETVIDMGDLGVILHSEFGIHSYFSSFEKYLKSRFEYSVQDMETDIQVVELGEL
jgi:hypothetical protein